MTSGSTGLAFAFSMTVPIIRSREGRPGDKVIEVRQTHAKIAG
jgi:hypothetical protein